MADENIIVFPTDFSTTSLAAVPWGKRMASVMGARLHAIYVLEEPQIYGTLEMGPLPIPTSEELIGGAEARMKKFVDTNLSGLDQPAEGKVLIGRPAEEIVQYAADVSAGMIVMALHGYSGMKHLILGSTTEAVLRHSRCPVFAVPNDQA